MQIAINQLEVVGILLAALGSLGAVLISVAKWRRTASPEKEMRLKIHDLEAMRDAVLKDMILSQYPDSQMNDLINKLNDAFAEADETFRKDYLPSVFGSKDAAKLNRVTQELEIFQP